MVYRLFENPSANTRLEPLTREYVHDEIINRFPLHFPLQQWLGRESTPQLWGEMPVDTFGGITRTEAAMAIISGTIDATIREEASSASYITDQYPSKIRFVTEIHQDAFSVSGTNLASDMYGIRNRFAYEGEKVAKKQMSDLELRMWFARGTTPNGSIANRTTGAETAPVGGAVYKRQTQGLMSWILTGGLERGAGISTNIYNTHGEALKSSSGDYRPHAYNAGGLVLDETMWNQSLMSPWYTMSSDVVGNKVAFMGSKPKQLFRSFALTTNGSINQRTIPAENKKIIDTVDFYESDFGTVMLNLCYFLNIGSQSTSYTLSDSSTVSAAWDSSILVIEPAMYKIRTYRAQEFSKLAKTGDFEPGMFVLEAGLQCRHPFGGAAIVNCVA